jgi:hypothetical protein
MRPAVEGAGAFFGGLWKCKTYEKLTKIDKIKFRNINISSQNNVGDSGTDNENTNSPSSSYPLWPKLELPQQSLSVDQRENGLGYGKGSNDKWAHNLRVSL